MGILSLVPNRLWWHVQAKEWKTENKNGTSTEDLPKSLEFSSMWFIFILVVFNLVPYSTSICTICQRRLLKALSHRNPKKEEMKLNRMKIKLAALWIVCLERKLTRGLMFLNSWERQGCIYKGKKDGRDKFKNILLFKTQSPKWESWWKSENCLLVLILATDMYHLVELRKKYDLNNLTFSLFLRYSRFVTHEYGFKDIIEDKITYSPINKDSLIIFLMVK